MSSKAYSAIVQGLNPVIVEVEVDQTDGLPVLTIIGLATKAVAEAKERITTALQSCGIKLKTKRTVVNLAPTDVKKSSPALDLAIVAALLKQNGLITTNLDSYLLLGEVGLDGQIKPVKGVLPIAWQASQYGFTTLVVPSANLGQLSLVKHCQVVACDHLQYLVKLLNQQPLPSISLTTQPQPKPRPARATAGFNAIVGQEVAKRALVLAAAGEHHLLLVGPPGSGKTKLAQALTELLPPLTNQESLETTAIHSVVSATPQPVVSRPFRSPHHSISAVGLLGGGAELLPGEISLAHHGVLFLDELTEFNRAALEAVRQPIEQKMIQLNRAQGSVIYPASFTLAGACNPCPCGFYGSQQKSCRCSPSVRERYHQKLSGPLLDRVDLVVWMEPSSLLEPANQPRSQPTIDLDLIQQIRLSLQSVPELQTNQLDYLLSKTTASAKRSLQRAETKLVLSSRGIIKVLRVALTISLLERQTEIRDSHILEALQYRWNK